MGNGKLVDVQVVRCNHVSRIVLLHLLEHLFFTSGLEAARGVGLVAAGVATMRQDEQMGLGTGGDLTELA